MPPKQKRSVTARQGPSQEQVDYDVLKQLEKTDELLKMRPNIFTEADYLDLYRALSSYFDTKKVFAEGANALARKK